MSYKLPCKKIAGYPFGQVCFAAGDPAVRLRGIRSQNKALWHEDALKDLKKIDKKDAEKIIEKVETSFTKYPQQLGKPLKTHLKGFCRYRIGKYRVIYLIKENELLIIILKAAKRDEVYKG